MAPLPRVRALVLPVHGRFWLWHAWQEPGTSTGSALQAAPEGWLARAQAAARSKAAGLVERTWHKFAAAEPSSLNGRLFKLAHAVLSRVDPSETFLKSMPRAAESVELLYPASLQERLVRRRLRLLAAAAEPFHRSRLRVWALALVPQLPLIPLPLPNVTLYFTGWRIYSNHAAAKGAAALSGALGLASDMQRLRLARQLVQLQQQGTQLRGWAAELAADADRLQQQVQAALASTQASSAGSGSAGAGSPEQPQQQQQQQQPQRLPPPVFMADTQLEELLQPRHRLTSTLPLATVERLAQLYHQDTLADHYNAAVRKCVAARSDTPPAQGGPG